MSGKGGQRKLTENGRTNLALLPQEVEFLRHTIINWQMYADVDTKYDVLSKQEVSALEENLIGVAEFFERQGVGYGYTKAG